MVRTRAFDQQETLRKVREVFWARGFAETSIDDLIEATGVGRQSLYNAYGNKAELYASAMRDYREGELERLHALLRRDLPLRVLLEQFFDAVIGLMMRQGGRGCFFANTAAEKDQVGADACAIVQDHLRGFEQALQLAIARALTRGELRSNRGPQAIAGFVLNTLTGLNAAARFAADRRQLRQVVEVALDAIA